MPLLLLEGPATEPISLAEARAWLRIDGSEEDALIGALIVAARLALEAATRRRFIAQTWRLTRDAWPLDGVVALPLAPVLSVAAVRTLDASATPTLADASTWRLVGAPDDARVAFSTIPPRPGLPYAGADVDFVAGYGATAAATPEPIRQAMRLLVGDWHENRGDHVREDDLDRLPGAVVALVAPFRRARLA